MEYWLNGTSMVARIAPGENAVAECFNWAESRWITHDGLGLEIRFTGEWDLIDEARAMEILGAAAAS
ncbi:hypothetical protein [Nocardioides sp. R-C-SC26]|uniref:hypothetical protein n=1 Tax=Nocardioides sp. R-C-SC26 TaxID=2870414 RepID=UPI001E54B2DC|nr:hypothetical protein [Nocardioides sp. R-C-SC26]